VYTTWDEIIAEHLSTRQQVVEHRQLVVCRQLNYIRHTLIVRALTIYKLYVIYVNKLGKYQKVRNQGRSDSRKQLNTQSASCILNTKEIVLDI